MASPSRPQEIALEEFPDCALVAELQLCFYRVEEAAGVLAERESRLTKLARDFIAIEEANTCL